MMRPIALIVLASFLFACTKTVPRPAVEVRRYKVEWEKLDAQQIKLGAVGVRGIEVRGIVLTPAQWPLEAGLTRLFEGDFTGFIEGLDLSFQASRLPDGVLRDLYEAGFLPVYLRVRNPGPKPLDFKPIQLGVQLDGDTVLLPVAVEDLPRSFRKTDWERTGMTVVVVLALVVLIVASSKNNRSQTLNPPIPHFRGIYSPRGPAEGTPGPSNDRGYLRRATLQPGETREGILFFLLEQKAADWKTARLIQLP
ncbi:MAG: hypothetical protein V3S64_12500 [bacterium]